MHDLLDDILHVSSKETHDYSCWFAVIAFTASGIKEVCSCNNCFHCEPEGCNHSKGSRCSLSLHGHINKVTVTLTKLQNLIFTARAFARKRKMV
jgi:hypothetical protein